MQAWANPQAMNTKSIKSKKPKVTLSAEEKLGHAVGMLLWIIQGLRNRSITSKPIMNTSPRVKEYGMTTLEDEIWKALKKCGITEKKP